LLKKQLIRFVCIVTVFTFAAVKTNTKQKITMKKFFAVFAIAGALVACNNASEGTESADTTTVVDTAVTVDTATVVDTAAPATVDSAAATVDTAAAAH
jgi:hypothetical protein